MKFLTHQNTRKIPKFEEKIFHQNFDISEKHRISVQFRNLY